MGYIKCEMKDYYQEPVQAVLDSVDLNRIKAASATNRALLQRAWQGDSEGVFPVISQSSVRNFYIEEDECGNRGMVYRDALRLQLNEAEKAVQAGALILPMVLCDFNVLAVSSLFNPDLVPSPNLDDANVLPVFKTRRDLERLEKPDIHQGLIPLILRETKRLRAGLPGCISVGVRMNTAPLSLASELRGATEIIFDMLEAPEAYHHFLGILTDLYIEVRRKDRRSRRRRTAEGRGPRGCVEPHGYERGLRLRRQHFAVGAKAIRGVCRTLSCEDIQCLRRRNPSFLRKDDADMAGLGQYAGMGCV